MKILTTACILLLIAACDHEQSVAATATTSDIKPDESVVFFNTSGWLDEAGQQWHLPIHGWVYEPQDSTVREATFARILESKYDLVVDDDTQANFSRRLNLLIADNERGKTIIINLAGRDYPLTASAENGHFESTIVLPATEANRSATAGFLHYTAVTAANDTRVFAGSIQLVKPDGFSVISDIDDTVKISNVADHRSLLEQTFLRDFSAAPGMADWYRRWPVDSTSFHYVSSSPWQLYEPLREFLDENDFPWAAFNLKGLRFRDETLLDLFKKGTETKPAAIRKILDRYPLRKFALVGDSGEQDPEVYAALLRERPQQILNIYIRNVTSETADNARFAALFHGIDEQRWRLFEDAGDL